jgi:PAS domain S-box-containing protein
MGNKIKILAIDDNQDNLVSLKALINEAFPDTITLTALSGAKGLELATTENPDVILLDIVMPGMDGFEVCKKLKADKMLCDIPVVFVTAIKGDKESRISALECGAEAFLAKPIDESELTAQIRAMVKIKQANTDKRDENKRLANLVDARTHLLQQELVERKQAEEALQVSEERYKRITSALTDYLYTVKVKDGKAIETTHNDACLSISGYSSDEFNADPYLWINMVVPEEREFVASRFLKILEGVDLPAFEHRIVCKNGKKRWISDTAIPRYNEKGIMVSYDGVIKDITERKLTDDKLRTSEAKFRAVAELSPIAIYASSGSDQKGIYVNETFYKIFGFSMDDVPTLGHLWIKAFPDEKYRQQVMDQWTYNIEQADKNNTDVEVLECVCACKDGSEKIIAWVSKTIGDEFWAFGYDFTERKQAEELLILAKEKAEISEAKFKGLYSRVADAIFIYNPDDFEILEANEATAKIYGYDLDELIGMSCLKFSAEVEKSKIVAEEIKQSGEAVVNVRHHKKKDGTDIFVQLNGYKIIANEQELMFTVCHDITNIKLTEQELIKAKEHAEESDRLKTVFLQNMSHEIRTPMNAIMGFSEMLVKNYNNKPKLEKFTGIITQRCADLLDIINDLLDIAKIESGQLPVSIEKCNLNVLFAELTLFFTEHQKRVGKQQIKFSLQVQGDTSNIFMATDKGKLKQIFINLISNAFKFTEAGTIEGGCKFDTNSNLIFYVSDTGIGIQPDKQKMIFDRFAQVEQSPNRLYGGTGLGLSIVKGLIGLLGGEMFLESQFAKGSTFSFTIPYKEISESPNESLVHEEPAEYKFSNKTILIVEDDLYNADYLKEILTEIGLNTLHAEFGKKAIEISISQPVDLVLMDIRLPDIDGYEATKQIRQHKPNLKIIAQTAYASHVDKQKAIDAGCNDYISKPTKPEALLSLINKHLLNQFL